MVVEPPAYSLVKRIVGITSGSSVVCCLGMMGSVGQDTGPSTLPWLSREKYLENTALLLEQVHGKPVVPNDKEAATQFMVQGLGNAIMSAWVEISKDGIRLSPLGVHYYNILISYVR